MALTMTTCQTGEVTVIGLSGRLDIGPGSEALHEVLQDVAADGTRKILLNMRAVSFIDSSGIGELASGHVLARRNGGALKLTCLSQRLATMMRMTGLHGVLDIYDEESDAIGSWDMPTAPSV
jgi:anti-sigma B factor antagonist